MTTGPPGESTPRTDEHRPALDGVRGIAVVAVLLNHTTRRAVGGFLGVDLFFVLSGFLITSLLLREHERSDGIDLRAFYVRRAVRLMPATLCALGLAGLMFAIGRGCTPLPFAYVAAVVLFYGSNWLQAIWPGSMGVLGHTWSLSIEEQYYFLWPVLVRWRLRSSAGVRSLARIASAMIAAVVVYRAVALLAGASTESLYVQTFSRIDAIMVGCLGALAVRTTADHPMLRLLGNQGVAAASLATFAVMVATTPRLGPFLYLGGFLIVAVISLSLVLFAARPDATQTLLGRALGAWPLVICGRVSYGLYLYHFVIMRGLGPEPGTAPSVRQLALEVVLYSVITWISFVFVERPAMAKRHALLRMLTPAAVIDSARRAS